MRKQNVTLALPKDLLRAAKKIAIERNTSLSALLTDLLERLVEDDDTRAAAREWHLAWLADAPDLGSGGEATWTRESSHER